MKLYLLKHRILLLPILIILISIISCTKDKKDVELISGFISYETINEIEKRLIENNYNWTVFEDYKLKEDDPRPPYHMYAIEIEKYTDLEIEGRLKLSFFNDRLYGTTFYPTDINTYLSKLLVDRNINLLQKKRYRKINITVVKYQDFENKLYIGYRNNKIIRELNNWIRNYS